MGLHFVFHFTLMKGPIPELSPNCWLISLGTKACLTCLEYYSLIAWHLSGWLDLICHMTVPWYDCFPKLHPNVVKSMWYHAWPFRKDFCSEPAFTFAFARSNNLLPSPVHESTSAYHLPSVCTLGNRKLGHTQTVAKFWPRNSIDVPEEQWKPKQAILWKILTSVSWVKNFSEFRFS